MADKVVKQVRWEGESVQEDNIQDETKTSVIKTGWKAVPSQSITPAEYLVSVGGSEEWEFEWEEEKDEAEDRLPEKLLKIPKVQIKRVPSKGQILILNTEELLALLKQIDPHNRSITLTSELLRKYLQQVLGLSVRIMQQPNQLYKITEILCIQNGIIPTKTINNHVTLFFYQILSTTVLE